MQSVHYILNSQSTHEQHRQTPKNSVTLPPPGGSFILETITLSSILCWVVSLHHHWYIFRVVKIVFRNPGSIVNIIQFP